jgi:hypothetical protein
MRRSSTLFPLLLCVSLLLTCFSRVKAAPPSPASFYGTVKINGENVTEGTIIRAIINGQVVATTQAILFQGQTVYDIDVPADDPNTAIVEGGQEGDIIRFMLAGFLVRETATWFSGTDTEFNLSLTTNPTLPPPQPTETPPPTQTAVILPTPTPTNLPTGGAITQPTQTLVTDPGPVSTATLPSTPTTSDLPLETEDALTPIEGTEAPRLTVTDVDQPTAEADPEIQTEINEESRGMGFVIPSIILSSFGAVGAVVFWVIRKNRKEDTGLLL